MKDLLDQKAIMSTRRSGRGQSPISIALNSCNADTARILLDKVHAAAVRLLLSFRRLVRHNGCLFVEFVIYVK